MSSIDFKEKAKELIELQKKLDLMEFQRSLLVKQLLKSKKSLLDCIGENDNDIDQVIFKYKNYDLSIDQDWYVRLEDEAVIIKESLKVEAL